MSETSKDVTLRTGISNEMLIGMRMLKNGHEDGASIEMPVECRCSLRSPTIATGRTDRL